MKKVFLIVMVLLGCGAAMKQANAQDVNYVYDTVEACSGSVVTLSAPPPTSLFVSRSLYIWYGSDTTSNGDTSNATILVLFNGTDTVVWNQRTDYNFLNRVVSVTWTRFTIHKEIVELPETRVECGSYVWHKPSGGTATLDSSGVYRDTVLTTCTKRIHILNLTIPRGLDTTITTPWCYPNHHWRGVTFDAPISIGGRTGYLFEHDTIGGCRVTDTIIVTNGVQVNPEIVYESACDSFVWSVTGLTYYSSEVTDSPKKTGFFTSLGCDSTQVLNLTIDTTKRGDITVTECDSYTWIDGITYVNSTTTTHTIERSFAYGCDSIVRLNLTINRSTTSEENQHACDSYTWHGTTYTATDTFRFDTLNAEGCTHTIWLNLTVDPTVIGKTDTVTACDSYNWRGKEYENNSDWPTKIFQDSMKYSSQYGCDSIVYLHLTLGRNRSFPEPPIESCDHFTWHRDDWHRDDMTYTESGVYNYEESNESGCKDYYQLNLTINHVQELGEGQTVCNEYLWTETGETYGSSGTYRATVDPERCEQHVLYLTVLGIAEPPVKDLVQKPLNGYDDCMMLIYPRDEDAPIYFYKWLINGEYKGDTNQFFKFKPSELRNSSISVLVSGIEFGKLDMCFSESGPHVVHLPPVKSSVKVVAQPNPNRGRFSVTLSEEDDPVVEAVLYNAYGTKVTAVRASAGVAYFDEALQPGMYLVVVTTQSGKTYTDKVVVDR